MLRVTRSESGDRTDFKLEGKLAGSWVDVMAQCWNQAAAEKRRGAISVDLNAITYVDGRGTELLCQMHRQGVELKARTVLGKGIVEQVRSCSKEEAGDCS